jgi:tetratricopeptide (TPR) repeat protein
LRLASFSIDSDIQRAAELTRRSIQIGLTPYLAETLERIRFRNQTLADDLCFNALSRLSENKDSGTTFVNYLGPYVLPGFGQSGAVAPARNPVLARFFLNEAFTAIIRQQLPAPPNGTYHELVINYMTVKALAPHFTHYLPDKSGTIANEINRRAVLLNSSELEAVNTYSDSNDVKELLKSSENTQNKNLKDSILAKAALLASEAGNVEEALSSADKIADDDVKRGVRTMVLHRAAMTAIREGEFEKAYEYAKDLDALVQRAALFAQLARAVAQRKKDLGRAVELLSEIKNAIDSGHEDANQRVRSALTITNAMAHLNPELSFEFMAFAVKLMNSTNLDFEVLTGPGTDALQPKDSELVNASLGLNQFLLGESFSQLAHQNYQQAMALALSIENKEGAALSKLAIAKRSLADAYSMKIARGNEEPGKHKAENEQLSSPARSLIKQLAAEEYDRAVERFDSNLKMTMPAHVLQDRWRTVVAEVGAFKRTINATPGRTQGYEVVTVKCEFDEGLLDVRVVYDKKKQVTGLFFIYPPK